MERLTVLVRVLNDTLDEISDEDTVDILFKLLLGLTVFIWTLNILLFIYGR